MRKSAVLVVLSACSPAPEGPTTPLLQLSESSLELVAQQPERVTELLTVRNPDDVERGVVFDGATDAIWIEPTSQVIPPREEVEFLVVYDASVSPSVQVDLDAFDQALEDLHTGSVRVRGSLVPPGGWGITCSAQPEEFAPPAEVELGVLETNDPEGRPILRYEWTVVEAPPTAAVAEAVLPTERGIFVQAELAGPYTFQVVAFTEEEPPSEPCLVTVEGKPEEELWVELSWSIPGDDLDLHLLAPGGTFGHEVLDCHWDNCVHDSPDWGVVEEGEDDPRLALDDLHKVGPENTRIRAPADGVYTVVVHDFPQSDDPTKLNTAVVRIFLGGELRAELELGLEGEDVQLPVAEIALPEGIVTAL